MYKTTVIIFASADSEESGAPPVKFKAEFRRLTAALSRKLVV
jgi:hypothetical protein